MSDITREWILSRKCRTSQIERLMKGVKVSESNCWERQTNLDRCGYGRFKIGGRQLGAHKISYILHKGDFDQSKYEVLHSCDNPCCINPDHLSVGTHKQNMRDMVSKGRHPSFIENRFKSNYAEFGMIAFFTKRQLAIANGERYYFGKMCKKHGTKIKHVFNGCVICRKENLKGG